MMSKAYFLILLYFELHYSPTKSCDVSISLKNSQFIGCTIKMCWNSCLYISLEKKKGKWEWYCLAKIVLRSLFVCNGLSFNNSHELQHVKSNNFIFILYLIAGSKSSTGTHFFLSAVSKYSQRKYSNNNIYNVSKFPKLALRKPLTVPTTGTQFLFDLSTTFTFRFICKHGQQFKWLSQPG